MSAPIQRSIGTEPLDRLVRHLRCPLTIIREGRELELKLEGGQLISPAGHRYPIKDDVPDLRPLHPGVELNPDDNYAFIHSRQSQYEPAPSKAGLKKLQETCGLRPDMVEQKRVLVAGSAMGTEVRMLCEAGCKEVIGLDYAGHIRTLSGELKFDGTDVMYVQGDLLSLPFPARYFDLVFSSGVVQHTRSPELGFRKICRVTKPGGWIVLAVAYPDNPTHRNVTSVRLKRQFHRLPPQQAEAQIKRRLRRRIFFEKLRLARLDYMLTGEFFPGQGQDFLTRLGMALDTYYPPYRHAIDPNEIRRWFWELGMSPTLPRNVAPYFHDTPESAFGSTKSYIARRP